MMSTKRYVALVGSLFVLLFGISSFVFAESKPGTFDKEMRPILQNYLNIHKSLAADTIEGIRPAANTIAKSARKLDLDSAPSNHRKYYASLPKALSEAAESIGKSSNIEQARESFKQLSKPLSIWATRSKPSGITVVYCPMAQAYWIQKTGAIRNPYYGEHMLTCGEVVDHASHSKKPVGSHSNGSCTEDSMEPSGHQQHGNTGHHSMKPGQHAGHGMCGMH